MKNLFKKKKEKKENINTPDFWDQQFLDEYKLLKGKPNKNSYYRWNEYRFSQIARFIRHGEGRQILDVGSGLGHLTRYIKARFPFHGVHGADFCPATVEKAREMSCDIDYYVNSCYELPFGEEMDYVIGTEIIEHLDKPGELLRQMKKVLIKGGTAIITTPLGDGVTVNSDDHVQEFTAKELKALMEQVGFMNVMVNTDHQRRQLFAVGEKYA